MSEKHETVEHLSEQIVGQYVGGAYLSGCARDCREKIEDWLRSKGIDPVTMSPMDQPTQQPEPEARDGDRELAEELGCISYHRNDIHWQQFVPNAQRRIADHLAAERAEAEAKHEKFVTYANERMRLKDDELHAIRTQLAATEAKLREAEGRVKKLEKGIVAASGPIENIRQLLHQIDKAHSKAYWAQQPQPTNAESE